MILTKINIVNNIYNHQYVIQVNIYNFNIKSTITEQVSIIVLIKVNISIQIIDDNNTNK